jgi:S1-C subfamily serine protease
MVLTSSGEVITNNHVVEGATRIRVKVMATGQKYAATVVGTDKKDDVAVLQLTGATGLSTVTTDTNGVSLGDAVTAVGDAGGATGRFHAATGTITGLGRSITTRSQDGSAQERLTHMIKISSDVISGDSGGATYDDQGDVIGMTTAASTGSSNVVGFAIPITRVLRIAGDLEGGVQNARYSYGNPAFLGIGLRGSGTLVAGAYRGTPAARAGIVGGDTITAVDGTRVSTATALRRAIESHQPGDSVRLAWTDSSGTTHTATVTLMSGPID